MSATPENLPLPRWLVWLGSAAIVFHLFALLIAVLATGSGPWPMPSGESRALAPKFAHDISEVTNGYYLRPLQMASSYHSLSNKTDIDSVFVEVQLRDEQNKVIQTLRLPDNKANLWVRSRQQLLALALADDEPVLPPRGEAIPAPGKSAPMETIWDSPDPSGPLRLTKVETHRIPRNRPVIRPMDSTQQLAKSYARHLCRETGAVSAELIRHSRRPLSPAMMFMNELPAPEAFEEMVCTFGELTGK
jgi:hypothetical protein